MFFENFPTTFYKTSNTTNVVVTDFIRAIKLDPRLKSDELFYYEYEAQDGETPEIISHKVYDSTQYHWVIMLINEKFDPWRDFPQSDYVIQKLAADKYDNVNAVHHREDSQGNWVDAFTAGASTVTNIEYERQLNEEKRSIKILRPDFLSQFVEQYNSLISV